ncbi:unnamed protein product [Cuscuta epithymum]|uniref:Uncharacterized protein n=1 Tax=Cuscuta epithymum TaxID=186058 RepID=A0AAV0C6U5_9ASTE|nr:unnamed protein product [Cuscuta epithymum]
MLLFSLKQIYYISIFHIFASSCVFFSEIMFALRDRRMTRDKQFSNRKEWEFGFKLGSRFNPKFQNQDLCVSWKRLITKWMILYDIFSHKEENLTTTKAVS